MQFSTKEKSYLLRLSRLTLEYRFREDKKYQVEEKDLPDPKLTEKTASFVTLTNDEELRGCIGNVLPKKKLYQDIIDNSLLAAFSDPRFAPLNEKEVDDVVIEISVLSKPKAYRFENIEELLNQIEINKHGLILQQGFNQATFLPQVWASFPEKEKFLSELAKKAGLKEDSWKDPGTEFFYYTTATFSEKNLD